MGTKINACILLEELNRRDIKKKEQNMPFFSTGRCAKSLVISLSRIFQRERLKKLSCIRQAFPFPWLGKPFAINGIKLGGVADPCFQIDTAIGRTGTAKKNKKPKRKAEKK